MGSGLAPLGAVAGGFVAHDLGVRAAYPIAGLVRGAALLIALSALTIALRPVPSGPGNQ